MTPCERAKYDAEHSIQRSVEMLNDLFTTDEEKREYLECYFELTGIMIGEEPLSVSEKVTSIIIVVAVLGVFGLVIMNQGVGSADFSGMNTIL